MLRGRCGLLVRLRQRGHLMQPAARGTRADLAKPVSTLIGQHRERYMPDVKRKARAAHTFEVAGSRRMHGSPPGGRVVRGVHNLRDNVS